MKPTNEYAAALELIVRVYRALDQSEGATLAKHFVVDPEWHRPEGVLKSRREIHQMAETRDPSRQTAHLVSNLAIEQTATGLRCQYQLTVYASAEKTGSVLAGILDCDDLLVENPEGLLVRSKRSAPRFIFKNEPR